jgi:hypothetical protein
MLVETLKGNQEFGYIRLAKSAKAPSPSYMHTFSAADSEWDKLYAEGVSKVWVAFWWKAYF